MHLLARLRALAQPVEDLVLLDVEARWLLTRLVVADDLDVAAIARAPTVGDDDPVARLLLLAHAHEANFDGHVQGFPSRRDNVARRRKGGRLAVRPRKMSVRDEVPLLAGLELAQVQPGEPSQLRALASTGERFHHLLNLLELLEESVHL